MSTQDDLRVNPAEPPTPAASGGAPQEPTSRRVAPLIAAGAGAFVFIGSFLTWATAGLGIFTVSVAGTDGDGKFTLVLGIAIAVTALIAWTTSPGAIIVTLLASIGAVGVGGYDWHDVNSKISAAKQQLNGNPFAGGLHASVGSGLYLVVVGGAIGVIASLVDMRRFGGLRRPVTNRQPATGGTAEPE
jgi:hypothetical protein